MHDLGPTARLVAGAAFALLAAGCGNHPGPVAGRTIVIGFDGLDPNLTERWMADGALPNLSKLRALGHYQHLATTNPPQSPVAWASFATGENPGEHGIFDFLTRDPATYLPDFSIAKVTPPAHALDIFGYHLPLSDPRIENRRVGPAFWSTLEAAGRRASVIRVPVTFPPDPIHRMLSGMGVPDLTGSQGTYTVYTTDPTGGDSTNAHIVRIFGQAGDVLTQLYGPRDPLKTASEPLTLPFAIHATPTGVHADLGKQSIDLRPRQWSDWVPVRFPVLPGYDVKGMVQFYLLEAFPHLRLYTSPINLDPREPAMPISSPAGYAKELAGRIGLFHTLGMPEETWSLNNGDLDDDAYLDLVKSVLAESEAMLFDTLGRRDSDLVVTVFAQTDRVSHMFWRGIDSQHPLFAETGPRARGAIKWIYGEADRIVGRVMAQLGPQDRLIVLSDHGFAPFRRAMNLNRWLIDQGYLVMRAGRDGSAPLFADVDWAHSRAYALGLNGIFINLKGREVSGVVEPSAMRALKDEIARSLATVDDTEQAKKAVSRVFDADTLYHGQMRGLAPDLVVGYARNYRASWQTALGGAPPRLFEDNRLPWSGDHCIDPALVPGVLFTSFTLTGDLPSIADAASLIRQTASLP